MPDQKNYRYIGQLSIKLNEAVWKGSEALYSFLAIAETAGNSSDQPYRPLAELLQVLKAEDSKTVETALASFTHGSDSEQDLQINCRLRSATASAAQIQICGTLVAAANGKAQFFGAVNVESEIQFTRKLFDHSHDLLAHLDCELKFTTINDAYAQIFGKSPAQLTGKPIAEAFSNSSDHFHQVILPKLQNCLKGNDCYFENWSEVPNKGRLFLEMHNTPIYDEQHNCLGIAIVGRNRTEAMETLEALQRRERLHKRTENIAKLGGWSYDVKSHSLRWTNEMFAIHEVAKDFVPSPESLATLIRHDHEKLADNLQLNIQGQPTDTTAVLYTPTGKKKWIRAVSFPVYENNEVVRVEGILHDITELTQAQNQARESQEKYRSLVEDTNAMVWEINLSNPLKLTYMSPQAEIITGYSSEQWCQTGFLESHIHPEDLNYLLKSVSENSALKQDFVIEYRILKADGSYISVHDNIKMIINPSGRLTKLRGVMVDISNIKSMQAGLSRALRSLENQKYILDQHAIVSTTDLTGNIRYVNEKFVEISGYEHDELLGQNHSMLQSGLHSKSFYSRLWQTISSGHAWQGEICNRKKNGQHYWVYTTIVPLTDDRGHVEEFMSIHTDITELKETEASLRRVQKMEAIGQLTGGIAHDFNNLLGIIIGNLELIEMSVPHREHLLSQIENAKTAAMRGSVLTRRLLNFSHQSPVNGKSLDLNTVITGLDVLISKSLTAAVRIELELSDDLWQVAADPGDFEDVIINLTINASDAMPHGGTLHFTTRNYESRRLEFRNNGMVPPGQYIELTISDTGTGMSPEICEKIFEPYFTTKPSDKGSGLGLAMVYGFVQRCKGLIFVDSVLGIGTTFTIFLPREEQEHLESPTPLPSRLEELPKAKNNETILLVDDEPDILKITRTNLENLGYRVISCNNGDKAIAVLEGADAIDLMFTDIVMPGQLNGYELAEEALKLQPDLKVLFTTGYAKVETDNTKSDWREALIQKPYRSADLSRKIRDTLDNGVALRL